MNRESLQILLDRGKTLHQNLLAEAANLLRKLDVLGAEGYERIMARRQECISELHEIDQCIVSYLNEMGGNLGQNLRHALDEYGTIREMSNRKVLEFDSLVIALSRDRLKTMKSELAVLARGKAALSGYENAGRTIRQNINGAA